MPAAISNTVETPPAPPPALPIQSDMHAFCRACEQRIRTVIVGQTRVALAPRIEIDTQRRLFDSLKWPTPTALNRVTVDLVSLATGQVPRWSCRAEFAAPAGFRFTDINLVNVDYWAPANPPHIAHVLKSVTFEGLAVDFADGQTFPLELPAALASPAFPQQFDASAKGDASTRYQVGARLALSWLVTHSPTHTCVVDAELSLVLGAMNNDIDPVGLMVACRLYPQLAMRVRSVTPGTPAIAALRGTITLVANNADASNLTGSLRTVASGHLTTSLFCESNRASAGGGPPGGGAAALDRRKRVMPLPVVLDVVPDRLLPLPHWSWIYDYCNVGVLGRVLFTAAWARRDGGPGTSAREVVLGGPAPAPATTIHKVARQGAYDTLCIHPDRGNDLAGKPLVAAPICADLGLHLHWRHGVSASGGPAPLHLFRGWGEGRLGQGAGTVLGAPVVPPNQRVDVEVFPAFDQSTVTLKYAVTASEIAIGRWQVFLEQGLAFAFQYAVEIASPPLVALSLEQQAAFAAVMDVGKTADVIARLRAALVSFDAFDAAVRDVWLSILKQVRRFDQVRDGSVDQQILDGPSDPNNLENL